MKYLIAFIGICITASTADGQQPNVAGRRFSPEQVGSVAPALEKYTQERLYGKVWERPGLNRRDRSLITIAALIARGQSPALGYYADQAIESGVTPREISETIVHLAYYSGWGNAMAAVGPVSEVFAKRGIDKDELPPEVPQPLPVDEAAEAQRAKNVGDQFGAVAPGLVEYTTDYLFRDLWLRPDLAPRDRSLVTFATLVASGQIAQITFHLNRAMDNGLTQEQAAEAITHLAFYVGWPNAMSALPVAKEVFAKRTGAGAAAAAEHDSTPLVVRIAELEIDPEQLDAYKAILAEEQEASVRLEAGVLMLHAVALVERPTQIRLLEVYANRAAYDAHLKAPHFVKYKTSTEKMVKSLRLIETTPILLCGKSKTQAGRLVSCI
jgi:4-carboxymuconolactone decarboxylase